MYTVQMVSITPCSPQAASLKQAPTLGRVGRSYIPRTRRGVEPPIAWVQLTGQLVVKSSPCSPATPSDQRVLQETRWHRPYAGEWAAGYWQSRIRSGWTWESKKVVLLLWFCSMLAWRHWPLIYLWPISSSYIGNETFFYPIVRD